MSYTPAHRGLPASGATRPSLAVLVGSILAWVLSTEAALGGGRVALVIGNSQYRSVASLPNPARDAHAVGEMFKKAGFDVVRAHHDVGYLDFKRALRRFEDTATDADIAVIYYAGHGIEIGGTNYLIPVNARLASDRDARDEAIPLDRLIRTAQPAKKLRLIILDACRDNPFAKTMKQQRYVRALHRGLGKIEPTTTNTLVAYASKAGSTAEDGEGENSPFALALLRNLVVPGLDVRLAFGRVRDDVLKQTAYRQEPFVYGSLGGSNISLVPKPAVPQEPAMSQVRGDYELVERIGSRRAWEVFLSTHKSGLYADLARAQLAKLDEELAVTPGATGVAHAKAKTKGKVLVAARVEVSAPVDVLPSRVRSEQTGGAAPPPALPGTSEAASPPAGTTTATLAPSIRPSSPPQPTEARHAWDRIEDSNDAAAFSDFMKRYPDSLLASTARKRLAALGRAAKESEAELEAVREADAACGRDEQQLAVVETTGDPKARRQGLERLRDKLSCDRLRPIVIAALKDADAAAAREEMEQTQKPAVDAAGLVLAMQQELSRIGCFGGATDGILGPVTRAGIGRYLAERDRADEDATVTDGLLADLRAEKTRVCRLRCSAGQVVRNDRCVAEHRPASSRRRDARHDRPQRIEQRVEKTKRWKDRAKATSRYARPARQEAAFSRRPGGGRSNVMIGVGF
jgi:hypothetical protein